MSPLSLNYALAAASVGAPYTAPETTFMKSNVAGFRVGGLGPADAEPTFEDFKSTFGKVYSVEEEAARAAAYADNVQYYESHNALYKAGKVTFYMGVNEFSDMTHEEFKAMYVGPKIEPREQKNVEILDESTAAESVDWRAKGAVTPVKNQGQCGSCWSFSTTGSTEGAVQIATGTLPVLSEQQLMDCSVPEGDHSCQGGLMDFAFQYIIDNKGLDSESDYPYIEANEPCNKARESRHVATITGFTDVQKESQAQLEAAVTIGPVSIAIEADQRSFQGYKGGVLTAACGTKLDHGVLAVGYGTDAGQEYWIVKNSWGGAWGEQGYIRLGKGNATGPGECGIMMQPSYPKGAGLAPPSPPTPPSPGPAPGPPGPAGEYGAPPCPSSETAVKIQGLDGSYCAPGCSATQPCPQAPGNASAQGQCVVEQPGSSSPSLCALICKPGVAGMCPAHATCEAIQGTGICMYTGSTPPPPPPSPPAPGGGDYAPPCKANEKAVTIQGVTGTFCAPSCSGQGSPCPAGSSGSAKGECVVEEPGSSSPSLCALICQPGSAGACPSGATCQAIQGVGICTWPAAVGVEAMLAHFDRLEITASI